jgi:hypothetical protein
MVRKADLTVDPAAEIEADVVSCAGNLPSLRAAPWSEQIHGCEIRLHILVAPTAHEMVAVVKGAADARERIALKLGWALI